MLNLFATPILVLCKDRVRYLDTTLKSISASVPSTTSVYISNDGTKNSKMIEYLTTNHRVLLDSHTYPNEHTGWQTYVGHIPNEQVATGIAKKAIVFMRNDCSGIRNLGQAVQRIFDTSDTHNLIKVEDDVIFKKGWYEKLISALVVNPNFGLVSASRYFFDNPVLKDHDRRIQQLTNGYTGGNIMIISRKLYQSSTKLTRNNNRSILHNDNLWFDECRSTGLFTGVTRKSLAQHIGVITEANHKPYMNGNQIVKVAFDLNPPYCLNPEVQNFFLNGLYHLS